MKLDNLRNFKFSNLNFYHYFFTSYIVLHLLFSILLGNLTVFAPDENLYKSIFSRIYSTGFTSDVLGFSGAWEPWLRLIYLPAKLLTYLGISDLLSVRILAIAASTLATFLITQIAKSNNQDSRIFRIALICISFIPTVFLWSSIGLRESFLYLEIAAIFYFLSRIYVERNIPNFMGLTIAVYSLAMTKNYIFILFLFGFILNFILFSLIQRRRFVTQLLILSISVMPLAFNPELVPAISGYFNGQVTKVDATESGDLNNDGRCDSFEPCSNGNGNGSGNGNEVGTVATGGMTIHALLDQLKSNPDTIIAKGAGLFGITTKLESIVKSSIVKEDDKSVLENQKKLSLQQAGLTKPMQVLKSAVRFLFVPVIFLDNGSFFLNIQSIETPIWVFIYLLALIALCRFARGRSEINYAGSLATIFIFEFIVISALTEINVGTALRHRSLLLIPILVIWVSREKKAIST